MCSSCTAGLVDDRKEQQDNNNTATPSKKQPSDVDDYMVEIAITLEWFNVLDIILRE